MKYQWQSLFSRSNFLIYFLNSHFRVYIWILDMPSWLYNIYTLSHPRAYGQRQIAAHKLRASIGRKIMEIQENHQNP